MKFIIKITILVSTVFFSGTAFSAAFVSSFGDLYVSPANTQVGILFQYDFPSDLVTKTKELNGGTATQTAGYLKMNTSTATNGETQVDSKQSLHYNPGHENQLFITAGFISGGAASSTQWVGLLTDENGWAIGFNGTDFSILHRNDSSDSTVAQSSFNGDKINGSGASGFNIDPTKINLFRISFGWLGVAPIKFQVCSDEGVWITFHTIQYPNTAQVPTVVNPTLPVRAHLKKTAGGTDLELRSACWSAGSAGTLVGMRQFSSGIEDYSLTSATDVPIFSIKNNTTFDSQTNHTLVRLVVTSCATEDTDLAYFTFILNPGTLTTPSWSDFETDVSVVQTDTAATTVAVGTGSVQFGVAANKRSIVNMALKANDVLIDLQPGDILTIAAKKLNNNTTCDALITWEEIV